MRKIRRNLVILCLFLSVVCIGCVSLLTSSTEVNAAAKIQLNKKSFTLTEGKSATLKLKGTKKKVKWSSSNKKVATVNQKGKVTAKKAGKAKITAKVEKKKYICNVKVIKSKNTEQPAPAQPTPQPAPEQPDNSWTATDAVNMKNYISAACGYANYACKYYNKAFSSGATKKVYATLSLNNIKAIRTELNLALQLANSKAVLATSDGKTLSEKISDAINAYNVVTVEEVNDENIDSVMKQLDSCTIDGEIKCVGVYSLCVQLLGTFL